MSSSSEWGAIPELEGLQARWEGMQASSRQKLLVSFLHLPRQASHAHVETAATTRGEALTPPASRPQLTR